MANIAPKAVLVLALDVPAATGSTSFTVTRPFVVTDVTSLCTTAAGGATLQVSRKVGLSTNTLTDLMTVAVLNDLTRCAVLTVAQRTFAIGDLVAVVVAVGAAASTTYMQILPSAIPGNS